MAIKTIDDAYLSDIGDAIRAANGQTDVVYRPKDMAAAIIQTVNIDPGCELWAYLRGEDVYNNDLSIAKTIITGIKAEDSTFKRIKGGINNAPKLKYVDLTKCSGNVWVPKFYNCPYLEKLQLTTVNTGTDIVNVSFSNDTEYTRNYGHFEGCPKLKTLIIPGGAGISDYWHVGRGSNIEKIYFRNKPLFNEIDTWYVDPSENEGFSGYCSILASFPKLTDIYVPWAQGEVLSSPYGMNQTKSDILEECPGLNKHNVNIHYNYVFTGNE